ncbi:MAG: hypothetical protein TYPL_0350 [Candidatus Tyloplasma litorale]|nr:MAG: hypothetical protein TYPL_0350 [Mycoplasmatales bacterium]
MIGGSIAALVLLTGAIVAGVMLGSKSGNGGIKRVTFFSNEDYYEDSGFNEATYDGSVAWADTTGENIGIQTATAGYSDTGEEYIDQFKDMFAKGADIIVSSGFNVAGIIGTYNYDTGQLVEDEQQLSSEFDNGLYQDKSFILIDDSDLIAAGANSHSASIYFESEQSGYLAGLAAGIYSMSVEDPEVDGDNIVGTWGGVIAPTISFLSGFEQGLAYVNSQEDANVGEHEDVLLTNGKTDDNGELQTITPVKGGTSNDYDWYTDSFDINSTDPGGQDAIARASNMKDVANVIFPVAGGQTLLALDTVTGTKTQIIGVDTSVELAEPGKADDNILGSATKEVATAAEYSIWYEDEFVEAYDSQTTVTTPINKLSTDEVQQIMSETNPDSPYANDEQAWKFAAQKDGNKDGWNQTVDQQTNIKNVDGEENTGNVFLGTYYNGGVGFTAVTESEANDSKIEIATQAVFGMSVEEFVETAMNNDGNNIEINSKSFQQ